MELTKEHFDQVVAGLTTKKDLDNAVAPLATSEQVEELAQMVSHGFEDVLERLDVRERVLKLEGDMAQIKSALHLSA